MSLLIPHLSKDLDYHGPSRILDQHFGIVLEPEDLTQPFTVPRMLFRSPAGYVRAWTSAAGRADAGSVVSFDKNTFQADLDVKQFQPDEISVKVTDGAYVIVEAKHEEKEDDYGKIYRHLIRRYVLPKNCDLTKVEAKLASDGVLTISAPRIGENLVEQKTVPITHVAEPSKQSKKKVRGKSPGKKSNGEKSSKK